LISLTEKEYLQQTNVKLVGPVSKALSYWSETPHHVGREGKPPTHKKKCKRTTQGSASPVANILEKILDTKPQEPKPNAFHRFFTTMPWTVCV
jgi:hypothetical protein